MGLKRDCCKHCGSKGHLRSTKKQCPKHPEYKKVVNIKKTRGRPMGVKVVFCRMCGPEVTDHHYCSKNQCPKHPEYNKVIKMKRGRGRPKGVKVSFCRMCGPEVTDHHYCSKKQCPKHPEYKGVVKTSEKVVSWAFL